MRVRPRVVGVIKLAGEVVPDVRAQTAISEQNELTSAVPEIVTVTGLFFVGQLRRRSDRSTRGMRGR
jgi:hypothetical protein